MTDCINCPHLGCSADVGRNVILTSGCIIGAFCQVNTCEVIPENTVIYGSGCMRRVQTERPQVRTSMAGNVSDIGFRFIVSFTGGKNEIWIIMLVYSNGDIRFSLLVLQLCIFDLFMQHTIWPICVEVKSWINIGLKQQTKKDVTFNLKWIFLCLMST